MHGGVTGVRRPQGGAHGNFRHGRYTAETIATRRWLRRRIREVESAEPDIEAVGRIGSPSPRPNEARSSLQPLRTRLQREVCHPGEVAIRSAQAGDEAEVNGINTDIENDWDRGGRCLCDPRGRAAHGCDDAHRPFDQIARECRQSIALVICPAILDNDIVAFDIAPFIQPSSEPTQFLRVSTGRCAAEEPDHRD